MALAQTDLPDLKRFTFFVSRRFEEGRERFRLHMGYFATLAEAEEWLAVVREIYPGAWAGEAPGRKLRERAAAAAAAQAQHAAGPQPREAPPVARAPASAPLAQVASPAPVISVAIPANVPIVHAPVVQAAPAPLPRTVPPVAATPARAVPPKVAPSAPRPATPVPAPRAAAPAAAATPPARTAPARTAPSRTAPATTQPAPQAAVAASRAAPPPRRKGVFEDSNVREVLAALGDASVTGETRLMRSPPPRVATPQPRAEGSLTDTQVLKLLEARGAQAGQQAGDVSGGGIPFLKPDDTATRRALHDAVANNAPVAFAVQLQWSVQPTELHKVPPLAIFSAFTLYTVEGSRDGRKWYGLRLGFFSDAISAKQVAHYVRSEFASVAVVPVSPAERARATEQDKKAAADVAAPGQARADASGEFKLLDDDGSHALPPAGPPPMLAADRAAAKFAARTAAKPQPKVAVGRAARQSAAAAARAKGSGRVGARERRGAQTLEETLEILGASALTIDSGNGETLNDTGVRHLRIEQQKNSPFARLLERLSERVKKS
jgi:hypothetical protein